MAQMKARSQGTGSSSHSHSNSQSRQSQANTLSVRAPTMTTAVMGSTTPIASPRMPHSVGQSYPPALNRLSPAIANDVRTPSPNYFGLSVEPSLDPRDSNAMPRENWSPPTSSIKSFAAALPKQLPLDANPEYEAFKRQADANRGKSFNLGGSNFSMPPPSSIRPKLPPRRPTNQTESSRHHDTISSRMDVDSDSLHDSAYVSSDSKRNSEASLNPPSVFDMPRHESPAQTDSPFQPMRRSNLSQVEDAHPRLSLPQNRLDRPMPNASKPRSETLPSNLENGPTLIMPNQLRDIINTVPSSEVLLLDVRVSTHYAQSRIQKALNLCIPTTLLKRATFDLQKLQKTLQTEEDQEQFSRWRQARYLIIYDNTSSEKRDALSAMNMFKKFANEGYSGKAYLLRGGFSAFATAYGDLIDRRSASERAGRPSVSQNGRPTFAPVIGGVTLPTTNNTPDPFFGNIRQNMDLADGVGQLDIAVPSSLDPTSLPSWLREASASSDHGRKVSSKFLSIERNEQTRMKDAYSNVKFDSEQDHEPQRVELCGIEKGSKNRYKDILPFEHARVRLADCEEGACDYINASYVNASRSNKRYIASQGPLPATFDDFWSVIWDQDVRVIVMLTAESEGGQVKCHPYWRSREYGPIRLKPLSEKKVSLDIDKHRSSSTATPSNAAFEYGRKRANTTTTLDSSTPTPPKLQTPSDNPFVVIRKFALSHAAHPFAPIREITHLHYPSWPDFGAPAQPSHLLALVELANVMQRAALPVDAKSLPLTFAPDLPATTGWSDEPEHDTSARPMLVHCSAGCGRTGTFCTVDSVIDMLKRQRVALMAAAKKNQPDNDVDMDEPISPLSRSGPNDAFIDRGNRAQTSSNILKPTLIRNMSEASVDVSWLGDDTLDLIEMTVEDFRGQRISMVQSLRQFVLCYESILEWVWRLQDRSNGGLSARSRARSGSLEAPPTR